jgi:hypothetical protein
MLYGPSNTDVIKVALLENKEACRQLANEVQIMRVAEEGGSVVRDRFPRLIKYGLDPEVRLFFNRDTLL